MSGTTDYGPLNKISEVEARYKNTEAKDHHAKTVEYRGKKYTVSKAYAKEFSKQIPLKFRRQEAIMEKSKDIARGSFLAAGIGGINAILTAGVLIPLILPPAIVGTIAFSIQKISESRFGKTIDLVGDKLSKQSYNKWSNWSYLDYINHLSKSRIDKNFKRGVIDEETSHILKALKEMIGEVRPKKSKLKLLEKEEAKLASKLKLMEKKTIPLNELLKISPDNHKAHAALEKINTDKKGVEESIEKNLKQIESITQEIEEIVAKYSEQLKRLQEKRYVKSQETTSVSNALNTEAKKLKDLKDQRKEDKKVLDLQKKIHKKYKSTNGYVDAQRFFKDKYEAYLKNCIKHRESPITQEKFIKKYYSKKGIHLET